MATLDLEALQLWLPRAVDCVLYDYSPRVAAARRAPRLHEAKEQIGELVELHLRGDNLGKRLVKI